MEEMTAVPVPWLLKGSVCEQYIRCSKSGCRCRTGPPHGPYYYRVWREGEQVHKVYVKRSELAAVRAACAAYDDTSAQLRRIRLERERLEVSIRGQIRMLQRFQKPGQE